MLGSKLSTLFCGFDQAGVHWCVLRLPSGSDPGDGDVDLLVDRADVQLMRQVLTQLDFVQLPGWGPGLHFLSFHPQTNEWQWLHIVTELSFGPYSLCRTQAESGCLNRRLREGQLVALAPDDAFWVLLLHCILDKGRIPLLHRPRLEELAGVAYIDSQLARVVASACPSDCDPARIVKYVRDHEWSELQQLAPVLAARWMKRHRIGKLQLLSQRVMRLRDKLLSLPRARGLGVALLGPDGAGKSTLITGIQESFILPVRSVYMGLTGGFLPYVDRLGVPILVIPGRFLIFWCRYLLAQYHQARGRLVIFDRYIYDSAIPTPYPLNWLKRAYRWIDGHTVPPPDLVLVLDAPGDMMYQRKGEYSPEQLEDWRHHFLALQDRITKLEIVDTSQPKDTVRADVINRIWRQYVARWGKN
jgi:thymidylate kinase